jgi:hypothetical protein
MMMIKDRLKVIRYFGYRNAYDYEIEMESDPLYEVYDIIDDPEEMNDLSSRSTSEVQEMIDALEQKYQEVSGEYQKDK